MRDYPLIAITLICCIFAVRRPVYGIVAYIAYSLLAPHDLTWGFARTFPHVLVIAICTIIGFVAWPESKRLPNEREVTFIFALWFIFAFSTIFAISSDNAIERLIYVSKVFLMTFLAMAIMNSQKRLNLLLQAIALSLGLIGVKIGLHVLRTGGQEAVYGPALSFLEANNSLGMALALNVPLLVFLSKYETRRWLKRSMWLMIALAYPAVVGTFSRGAWVALAAATGLMALRSKHKILIIVLCAFVVMLTPVWLPMVVSEQLSGRYDTLVNYEDDHSAQSRFWNWTFCGKVASAHPLEGGGFDYYSKDAYRIYYPEFLEAFPGQVWSCHSTWLTILSEHGIPGFLVWILLIGSCFVSLWKLKAQGDKNPQLPWISDYAEMLQVSLVAYCVAGTFIDIAYFEVLYLLICALVIMKEQVGKILRSQQVDAVEAKRSATPQSNFS